MRSLLISVVLACTLVAGAEEMKALPRDDVYSRAAAGTYTVPAELTNFRVVSSTPLKLDNAEAAGYDLNKWQSDPSRIIYHEGKYHVWMIDGFDCDMVVYDHINERPANGLSWIRYLTSKDGKTWHSVGYIPLGPKGSCYDMAIEQANVFMHEGRFYLFSEGLTTNREKYGRKLAGIICLVAEAPEGPWKQVGDLLVRPVDDPTSWESKAVLNPRHVFFEDKWFMYYKGWKEGEPTDNGVAIADSLTGPYKKYRNKGYIGDFRDTGGDPLLHGHGQFAWRYKHGIIMVSFEYNGKNDSRILWTEDGVHFVPLAEGEGTFLFGSLYCPYDPLFGKPVTGEPTTKYWGLQTVVHPGPTGCDVERIEWEFGPAATVSDEAAEGSRDEEQEDGELQAGFYTPKKEGELWDTWVVYHEGRYYQYYLAGPYAAWVGHDLAISDDGVHWKERGRIAGRREGVTMMGSGQLWKSPDFEKSGQWIANYSEWVGSHAEGKQDIMFMTSSDLVHWTKVDEKLRFVQDTRWYRERGRWDCIDAVQREDGTLYGYFTADPEPEKVDYTPCGFGFAQSKDGVTWEALPPVEGDLTGDLGGIQKIGDKYYVLISHFPGHGRVAVSDKPEGPFLSQKKNHRLFGRQVDSDACFPRFIHNGPGGVLVNHHYMGGVPYSAPFKAVEIDGEGVLRLTWWKGNEKLKSEEVDFSLSGKEGCAASMVMVDKKIDLARVAVIEGTVRLAGKADGKGPGVFFDHGDGSGHCVLFGAESTMFGTVKSDGSGLAVATTLGQDMNYGQQARFRVVMKHDMMECYVNDYLTMVKRVQCNGQIGFMGGADGEAVKGVRIWQSK